MNLDDYITAHQVETPSRWIKNHPEEVCQAKAAIQRGVTKALVYRWLRDQCGYPGGKSTFKELSLEWTQGESVGYSIR